MVEPTESESKYELDRFCDAMISIHAEMTAVETGTADAKNNLLKNAPHTAEMLIAGDCKHQYPAADGGYPRGVPGARGARGANPGRSAHDLHARPKYWPPVRRIDSAYGDRNLICACPAPEAYEG